ncbi:MAG: hypothetical protein NZ521_04265 [Flammeovirgaceae bacterium]|nr:hypothetical protein [Flammeovirgaceae bacterium]MDW8287176.1 hypothetical protein [Flammeovirgaceae bacterium]
MERKIQLVNNFAKFKGEFKADTGLEADENMQLYVHYVNARLADYSVQMAVHTMGEIINLPHYLASRINNKQENPVTQNA